MFLEDEFCVEEVFSESSLMTVLGRELSSVGFNSANSVTLVFKKEINSRLYFFEVLKDFIRLSGFSKKLFFLGSFDFLTEIFMADAKFGVPMVSQDFFFLSFRGQNVFLSFISFFFRQQATGSFFYSFVYVFLPPRIRGGELNAFNLMSLLCSSTGSLASSLTNGQLTNLRSFLFSKEIYGSFGFINMIWQSPLRFLLLVLKYLSNGDLVLGENGGERV